MKNYTFISLILFFLLWFSLYTIFPVFHISTKIGVSLIMVTLTN